MRWWIESSIIERLLIGVLIIVAAIGLWLAIPRGNWPFDKREKQALDQAPDICVKYPNGKDHCEDPKGKQTTTVIDGYDINRQPVP